MGKILMFYDSRTDCTKQMAELVAEGARSIPSNEVRIRSVDDCVADDVLWADGLAVGTPTNLGGVSWKMKRWWDEEFAPNYWDKVDGKLCCVFSSQGGHAGGAELACQAMANVLLNFGFLFFGVTDYVTKMHTLHYGACVAKKPRNDYDKLVCQRLGLRLSEWVAYYVDNLNHLHPLKTTKSTVSLANVEDESEIGKPKDYDVEQSQVHLIVIKNVPEENQKEWLQMAEKLSIETRKEDGCIHYSFVKARDSTSKFIIVEKWASHEHLQVHTKTPHFTDLVPKMDGISETLSLDLCDPALSMDKENFHILPKAQQKLKVLIYTRALDYIHSSTPAAASFLYSYCIQQDWDVTVSDENELMETPNAPEWDVIILLNNSGAIFDPKSQILTKHIEDGKGVLGVHAALACFLNGKDAEGLTLMEATCPIIEDTFGAHFKNHPLPQKGTVKVNQEITKDFKGLESLPDEFVHEDEFFNFSKNPCDNKNIVPLLFADESTYEGGLMGEKHPLVWYQYLGDKKAPIFYCAIGHFSHFYNNTRRGPKHVQTILKAGLQFVAKNK